MHAPPQKFPYDDAERESVVDARPGALRARLVRVCVEEEVAPAAHEVVAGLGAEGSVSAAGLAVLERRPRGRRDLPRAQPAHVGEELLVDLLARPRPEIDDAPGGER